MIETTADVTQNNEYNYHAILSPQQEQALPVAIKGCPLGRGTTADEALKDLSRRIKYESDVDIECTQGRLTIA